MKIYSEKPRLNPMGILAQLNLSPETKRAVKYQRTKRKNEFTNSHSIFKNKIWERILHKTDTFHKKKQVLFHIPPLLAREQNISTDQQQQNHHQMKTKSFIGLHVLCLLAADQ